MELHLSIVGYLLITLALMHVPFPRYFNWEKELASLNLLLRQMMKVHTFFIAFFVLLIGVLCVHSADDILNTKLGHDLALGLFAFWVTRLFFQWFVYSPQLWTGKPFETVVHVLFSCIWIYFSTVFFLIYWD